MGECVMDEEKTISMRDIMKVLLGNKWVYLIMVAGFAIASFVSLKITSSAKKEYVTFFDYDIAGFNRADDGTARFIDGEKFDPRAMITKEKILSYVESNEELKGLDVNAIAKKNGIKSFTYSATYKENDHKMNEYDSAYIADKVGYKLVLDPSLFSYEEAQVFSKALANEAIRMTREKIGHLFYRTYLNYYDSTYSYVDQISYLNGGIAYLNSLVDSLVNEYGDVVLPAGECGPGENYKIESMKLSDWKENININFERYKVSTLQDELELGGYIDDRSSEYISSLKTTIENLNREISTDESILAKLTSQRDDLVSSVGATVTIESLEIGGYNNEIIELTKTIDNKKEQVKRYEIQLKKLNIDDLSDDEKAIYNAGLPVFKEKLSKIRTALGLYTEQYEVIAKKVMNDNMNVYFDSSNIVNEEGGMSIGVIIGISAVVGIFVPMLVNLAIAGFALGEGKPLLKAKKKN